MRRILSLAALCVATSSLFADEITIVADRDNTLYQSETGSLSNGLGSHLFVGRTAQEDALSRRRSLVRFDLSSIPAGSVVTQVTLSLYCSRANQSGPTAVTLHRLLADWGEGASSASGQEGAGADAETGDATWLHRFYTAQLWTTPGGDFAAAPSASTSVGGEGFYAWSSAQLVADAQAWVDGTAQNHGWLVLGDESAPATAKRLDSRQNNSADQRPRLTIAFTPPDEPGACCLPDGCAILTGSECAALGGTFFGSGSSCEPDPCAGAEITLVSSKDNTMYESATGSLSNGAGIGIFAGTTNTLQRRRGLLQFDLSQVPPGAVVTDASLTLYLSFTQAQNSHAVALHRTLSSWGEGTSDASGNESGGAAATPGDATWLHRFFSTVFWSAIGGDFQAAPSASTTVGTTTGFHSWTSAGLVADVQAWIDDPSANHGWTLVGTEGSGQTQRRFDSRESTVPSQRPALTISYALAPAGGACCLPDGSCVSVDADDCAALGGIYQGDGTECGLVECPMPMGACCLPDATCIETSASECAARGGTYQGDASMCMDIACPLVLEPFVDALPRPAIAAPIAGKAGGEAVYRIEITQFEQELHRDLPPTTVWGYAGSYPGPTIEARRDAPVTVTWANELRGPDGRLLLEHYLPVDHCMHGPHMEGSTPRVVTHLHGGVVPFEFDGYPEFTILPGQETTYVYPNIQEAGTLWYHDHALGITRLNVYMGLAGFYLLRDDEEDALDLPAGEFEIPLAIQDRSFHPDGRLAYPEMWMEHFFGDVILVNGKVWPYLEVKRGAYRFRVLNGSGSRAYTLALSDGATFRQIGTDVGLLEAPVPLTSLTLTPGERADIVIDFAGYPAGTELVLLNSAPAPFPGPAGEGVVPNVMKFVVLDEPGHVAPLPSLLRPFEPIPEEEAIAERSFELRKFPEACAGSHWLINGLLWDDITEVVRLDTTEIWSWVNRSGVTHPMHMHLVAFQILDRQNFVISAGQVVPVGERMPPAPNERGWKDTVQAPPSQITRVIARFVGFEGLFSYHCHILEHEDHEMMRQFRTVPRADLNLDGDVGAADLAILLGAWGQADPIADLDGDGIVGASDLAILLGAWTG